jgi:Domain of unknown function (DUF4124)
VVAVPSKRSTFGFSLHVSSTGMVEPQAKCGRVTRTSPRETIAKESGVTRFAEVDCNVAPSQIVETIISINGEKRLGPMRWGFVSLTAKEPKPRSRPDRSTRLAIVLSLVVVASASAQAIQEWKTPDGTLFFGDRPPAGSIRVGEVGSDSQPTEPVLSLKTFAAKASQSRGELEQTLRRNSDRLWAIRDQLDKVESLKPKDDPEFVMSEQEATDLAAFQARKAETLRRLSEAERRSYSAIAGLEEPGRAELEGRRALRRQVARLVARQSQLPKLRDPRRSGRRPEIGPWASRVSGPCGVARRYLTWPPVPSQPAHRTSSWRDPLPDAGDPAHGCPI